MSDSSIVLVHGAWHSALHWERVRARLDEAGRHSVALDLPAHGVNRGENAAEVTQDLAAQAVLRALRELGMSNKAILVGHSLAGPIITRAAELAPELIGRLVYVSAHLPIRLKSAAAYVSLPEWHTGYGQTIFLGDPAALGVVRIDPNGDNRYLEELREAYYNDVEFAQFLPYARALTPDLPLAFWTGETHVTADRWGRVLRTYVRCMLDRALAPAIQSMMIADADELTPNNRFEVVDLIASHSPFISQPDELGDILLSLDSRISNSSGCGVSSERGGERRGT